MLVNFLSLNDYTTTSNLRMVGLKNVAGLTTLFCNMLHPEQEIGDYYSLPMPAQSLKLQSLKLNTSLDSPQENFRNYIISFPL